ncbi:transcriptional regulator, partial [Acinetobacter baumannii]
RRQSQWVYYSINQQLPAWCFEILDTLKKTSSSQVVSNTNTLSINSYCE